MRIHLLLLLLPALLAACSSVDPYTKRAEIERERQEQYVERAIDKAPKWMSVLPASDSAIYESGTGISGDFSMADIKAKADAYGKICMVIGGTASQRTKIFKRDTNRTSTENTEMAMRTQCKEIDLSGVEVRELKRVKEGGRYRTYVLVALPLGDANQIRQEKEQTKQESISNERMSESFEALDAD
jgi:hypothetical protein